MPEKIAGAWKHIGDTDEFIAEARKLWRTWKLK